MALAITHAFVSAIADGGDTSLVQPSNWNASHTLTGQASVAQGGTGLSAGTSGGVLAFTASGTIASSAALTANALVFGGGAGAVPSTPLGLGTTSQVLIGNAAGAPSWGSVNFATMGTGILPLANGGVAGASHFVYKSQNFYSTIRSSQADVVCAANLLVATPVTISASVTIDALGVYVVTGDGAAGAKSVNLAIYDDSSGSPGNQVARISAVVSVSSSAVEVTQAMNGGNVTLGPGKYWLASLWSGTPTVRGIATATDFAAASIMGGSQMLRQTSTSTNFIAKTGSATYPNFPNSNGAFGTATESNANQPLTFFRVA